MNKHQTGPVMDCLLWGIYDNIDETIIENYLMIANNCLSKATTFMSIHLDSGNGVVINIAKWQKH